MLNKIIITIAVLFLGVSLANAETYNEFRTKNGMKSESKIVKSSTSAKFQLATPKSNNTMAKFEQNYKLPEYKLVSDITADKLKLSDIHVSLFRKGFIQDFERHLKNVDSYVRVVSHLEYQKLKVYNIDNLNNAILNKETAIVLALKDQCLFFAKEEIRKGKKISWIILALSQHELDLTPINETRIFVNEMYKNAACTFYEK